MVVRIILLIIGIIITIIGVSVSEDAKNSYAGLGRYVNEDRATAGEVVAIIGVVIIIVAIILLMIEINKRTYRKKAMKMCKCLNCGNIVPNTMRFCDKCGKELNYINNQQKTNSTLNDRRENGSIYRLKELKEMLDKGYISDEEYEIKRKDIVDKI